MTENEGRMAELELLRSIQHHVGRIDGKFDLQDKRLRALEEKEAARAATEMIEREVLSALKAEVHEIKVVATEHESESDVREAIKKYWYLIAFIVVPVVLNMIWLGMQILKGVGK